MDIIKKQNNEGFSLVEIMIASGILALIFMGFMASFIQATRLQYMANKNYCASVIARNRIEQLKVYAYETVLTMVETNTRVNENCVYCPTGWYWRSTFIKTSANNSNCVDIICSVMYWTKPGVTAEAPVQVYTMLGG